MAKNKLEGDFTGKLLATYRKTYLNAIVFKIADRITLGIPDTIITLEGYTAFFEMKVIRDGDLWNLKGLGKGIQHNTCMKLSEQGICWYVVFVDRKDDKRILLVEPRDIYIENPAWEVTGHDYKEFVKFMYLEHSGMVKS